MPSTTGEVKARDGTRLRTRRWRPEDEPWALVQLVHGLAEHSGRYERIGSLLAEAGLDVHAVDLRGHGGSGGTRGDIARWESLHDDIEDALVRLRAGSSDGDAGRRPVVLLGHSMGGLVALDYVLAGRPAPDLLVLGSPAIDDALPGWQHRLVPILSRFAPTMLVATAWDGATLSRDPVVGQAVDADPACLTRITTRTGRGGFAAQVRTRKALERLAVPTWVHHGSDDRLVPPRASEPLGRLPGVSRRVYQGLRHECFNEPEGPQVVADIVAWLRTQVARAAGGPADRTGVDWMHNRRSPPGSATTR